MTILESEDLCVICIYRSDQDKSLCNQLAEVIPASTPCLVIGDINICSMAASNHEVFTMLKVMGFSLLVTEATHITGGHIDQAWLRRPLHKNEVFNTQLYSPYYNARDHDCILFTLYTPHKEQGKVSSLVYNSNEDYYFQELSKKIKNLDDTDQQKEFLETNAIQKEMKITKD